jgi:predicted transcriptional regulator
MILTNGIEIEVYDVTVADVKRDLPNNLKRSVSIVRDGSLGSNGCEIVLPPLTDCSQTWQFVNNIMQALTDMGARVHVDCGIHVHIGNKPLKDGITKGDFNDISLNNWFVTSGNRNLVNDMLGDELDWQLVGDVMKRYATQQTTINSMLPQSRRNSRWANHLNLDALNNATSLRHLQNATRGKYSVINLETWSKGTIEFRQHHCTLEMPKLRAWVKMITNLFTWSLDNRFEQGNATQVIATPQRHPSRRNSRIGIVYQLIRSENGATVGELMLACGNTANNIRRIISELRNEFGDNSIVTHTQQANNHSYGDGEEFSGYTMLEEYTIPSTGLTPLPENRSGNMSIWSGLDDDIFEFLHDRIEEIARR